MIAPLKLIKRADGAPVKRKVNGSLALVTNRVNCPPLEQLIGKAVNP